MARVLFLGGLGRSGTTLVERLLGELPSVCALGEIVHLWQRDIRDDERCGCGARFSACTFWKRVGERAFGGWHRVDVDRVHALRDAVERTRHIPRLAASRQARTRSASTPATTPGSTRAAAEVSGAQVIVDSSKHSALAHVLRWADDIDLRVVHVVRDARGVAYSWTKTVTRPETDGTRRDDPLLARPLGAAVERAQRRVRPARPPRRGGAPDPVRAVPRRPADRAARTRRLSPASRSPTPTSASSATGTPTSASGTARPATRCGSPSAVCRCAATTPGRRALPRAQRRLVGAVCAPMLRAYGYPLNPVQAQEA